MKITNNSYLACALSGLVFVITLFCSQYALSWLAKALFPLAFEGMAALVFGGLTYTGVLVLSLLLAVYVSHFLLRLAKDRVFMLLCGPIIALEAIAGIMFALPEFNLLIVGGIMISASMASFILAAFLTNFPWSPRIMVMISLVLLLGYVATVQYSAGTRRAQLHGLQNAGFTIYIPSENNTGIYAQSVASINDRYDGYKDGVVITLFRSEGGLDINPYVYETKVSELPISNCGNEYLPDFTDKAADKYTCDLVSDTKGIRIYSRISKVYSSYDDCVKVTKDYFAVAGKTYVRNEGGGNTYCENKNNNVANDYPDGAQRIEKVKTLLISLEPAREQQLKQLTIGQ